MGAFKETERRFLVEWLDPAVLAFPARHIWQAYVPSMSPHTTLRVRVTDAPSADLATKVGIGIERTEDPQPIDLAAGRYLWQRLPYRLEKDRRELQGWIVDVFAPPLDGIVIAEYEGADADRAVLPTWCRGRDVTESVTSYHLAKLAYELDGAALEHPAAELLAPRLPQVVLTGGPCSGKSSVLAFIRDQFDGRVHCVPEVATILIAQVGVLPGPDAYTNHQFQRMLYRVQRDFEEASSRRAVLDGKEALLVDRGSADQAAYVAGGVPQLETLFGTSRAAEYARYDTVLFLDMPPRDVYEQMLRANPARYEKTYEDACARAAAVHVIWREHQRFVEIPSAASWDAKCAAAAEAFSAFLNRIARAPAAVSP